MKSVNIRTKTRLNSCAFVYFDIDGKALILLFLIRKSFFLFTISGEDHRYDSKRDCC
jgi:hypothetical protein